MLAQLCRTREDAKPKKAGESRLNLGEAHYYIGLARLAEGSRAEAKACFRCSIDDPDWLPWVPLEE
jgi:hypothetical protein